MGRLSSVIMLLLLLGMLSIAPAYNLEWTTGESINDDLVGLEKWTSHGPMVYSNAEGEYVYLSDYPANDIYRIVTSLDFYTAGTYEISEDIIASCNPANIAIDDNTFILEVVENWPNDDLVIDFLQDVDFIFDNVSLKLLSVVGEPNDIYIDGNDHDAHFVFNSNIYSSTYPLSLNLWGNYNQSDLIIHDINPSASTAFFQINGSAQYTCYIDLFSLYNIQIDATDNCVGDFMSFDYCHFNVLPAPNPSGIKMVSCTINNMNNIVYLSDNVSHGVNGTSHNLFNFYDDSFSNNNSLIRVYNMGDDVKIKMENITFASDRGNNGIIYGTFMAGSVFEDSWINIKRSTFSAATIGEEYQGYGIKLEMGNAYLSVLDVGINHCLNDGIYLDSYRDATPYTVYPYRFYCNYFIDSETIETSDFTHNRNGIQLEGLPQTVKMVYANCDYNDENGMVMRIENDDEVSLLLESAGNHFNYNLDAGFKIREYDTNSPVAGLKATFYGGEEFKFNGDGSLADPLESGLVLYTANPDLDMNYDNQITMIQNEYEIEYKGYVVEIDEGAQHLDYNEHHGIYIEGRHNSLTKLGEADDFITCDSNTLNGMRIYGAQNKIYAEYTRYNGNYVNGTHIYSTLVPDEEYDDCNQHVTMKICYLNSNRENGCFIEHYNPKIKDLVDNHYYYLGRINNVPMRSKASYNGVIPVVNPAELHFAGIKSEQHYGRVIIDSAEVISNTNTECPDLPVDGIYINGDKSDERNFLYAGACLIMFNRDKGINITSNTEYAQLVARTNVIAANHEHGILAVPSVFDYFSIFHNRVTENEYDGISVMTPQIGYNSVPYNMGLGVWAVSQIVGNWVDENCVDNTDTYSSIEVDVPATVAVSNNYCFRDDYGIFLENGDYQVYNNIVDETIYPVTLTSSTYSFLNNTIFPTRYAADTFPTVLLINSSGDAFSNILGQRNGPLSWEALVVTGTSTVNVSGNLFFDELADDPTRVLSDYINGPYTDEGYNLIDPPCLFNVLDFYATWELAETNIPGYFPLQYHPYSYSPAINIYPDITVPHTEDYDGTIADAGAFGGPLAYRPLYYPNKFLEPYNVMGINLTNPRSEWTMRDVGTGDDTVIDLRADFYYMVTPVRCSHTSPWEVENGVKVFVTNHHLFPAIEDNILNRIRCETAIDVNGAFSEYSYPAGPMGQDLSGRVEFAYVSTDDDILVSTYHNDNWQGIVLEDGSEASEFDFCYISDAAVAIDIIDEDDDFVIGYGADLEDVHLYNNIIGIRVEGSEDGMVLIDGLRSAKQEEGLKVLSDAKVSIENSDIWYTGENAIYAYGTTGHQPELYVDNVDFNQRIPGIWWQNWSSLASPLNRQGFVGDEVNGDCNISMTNTYFEVKNCDEIDNFGDDDDMDYGIYINNAYYSPPSMISYIFNCTVDGSSVNSGNECGIAIRSTACMKLIEVTVQNCGDDAQTLDNAPTEYEHIGGIHIYDSSPKLTDCEVIDNEPVGLIIQEDSHPTIQGIAYGGSHFTGNGADIATPGTYAGAQIFIQGLTDATLCEPVINYNTITQPNGMLAPSRLVNDSNSPTTPHIVDATFNWYPDGPNPPANYFNVPDPDETLATFGDPDQQMLLAFRDGMIAYDAAEYQLAADNLNKVIKMNPAGNMAATAATYAVQARMAVEGLEAADDLAASYSRRYPDTRLAERMKWIGPELRRMLGQPDVAYEMLDKMREKATNLTDSVHAAIDQILLESLLVSSSDVTSKESGRKTASASRQQRIKALMARLQGQSREEETLLPTEYALHSPWPNPFNSTVRISYDLPEQSEVSLAVFDLLGRQVEKLVSGQVQAGRHQTFFQGDRLASGTYFVRMNANGFIGTSKIVLVK